MKAPKESAIDFWNWILSELAKRLPPPLEPTDTHWFGCSPAKALAGINGLDAPAIRDGWYWAVDANTCIDWLREAHTAAPAYRPITKKKRGVDCDKFAHWLVSFFYIRAHNRIWEVWGNTPQGFHAWNVLDNELGRFEVEPQRCDIWGIGTNPDYQIVFWVVPMPRGKSVLSEVAP